MAKKTDGVAAKSKAKLPKRIGGVKLPKELRKASGRILKAAASPAGRELIAAGLAMAAAAASAAVEKDRARRRAPLNAAPDAPPKPPTPPRPANSPGHDPHEIGVQLGRLAESALSGLFGPKKG